MKLHLHSNISKATRDKDRERNNVASDLLCHSLMCVTNMWIS